MLVSIIIPVYNVGQRLERCLRSVLLQGLEDCEVIVVDDGSTDGSREMCDRWAAKDSRFRVIHQPNGGLSAARNTGIDMAKGMFLTFVDSDDYLSEGTLQPLVSRMLEDETISIIEYNVVRHATDGTEKSLGIADMEWQETTDYWFRGHAYTHTYAWNKIYRRDVFEGVRFPVGRTFEDVHTLPRLLRNVKGRVVTTSQGAYHYVDNPHGITQNARREDHESLLDAHINYLETHRKEMAAVPLAFATEYYTHVLNIQVTATSCYRVPIRLLGMDKYVGRWGVFSGKVAFPSRLKLLFARVFGVKLLLKVYRLALKVER